MNGIQLSNGSLSLIVFLGKKELPKTLDIMINNNDICSQVLILGKRGIWKDGKKFYEFQDDSDWYQFEYLSALLNGEK